jgi:hypothetical protein
MNAAVNAAPADDEEDFEVEVEEEGSPAPAQGAAPEEPEEPDDLSDEPDEEELQSYGEKVRRRIQKLTQQKREEQERRTQIERDRDEAMRVLAALRDQNQQLTQRARQSDAVLVAQHEARLNAEIETVKRAYRDATEAGDTDRQFEAQQRLSALAVDADRLRQAKSRLQAAGTIPAQQPAQQPAQNYQQPAQNYQQPAQNYQQPAQQPTPDPRAQDWARRNTWFGQDPVRTGQALGHHYELVQQGIDPTSDRYYTELDARMQGTTAPARSPRVVSPSSSASRAPASGKTRIKLTASQVSIARSLGVTPEQYARELAKMNKGQ